MPVQETNVARPSSPAGRLDRAGATACCDWPGNWCGVKKRTVFSASECCDGVKAKGRRGLQDAGNEEA